MLLCGDTLHRKELRLNACEIFRDAMSRIWRVGNAAFRGDGLLSPAKEHCFFFLTGIVNKAQYVFAVFDKF